MEIREEDINKIRSIAFSLCRQYRVSNNTVEDLVQDACLKILEKIDKYDASKASWNSWIMSIANNAMINKVLEYDIPVKIPKTSWQQGIKQSTENSHGTAIIEKMVKTGPGSTIIDIDWTENLSGVDDLNKFRTLTNFPISSENTDIEKDIVEQIIALCKEPDFCEIFNSWYETWCHAPYIIRKTIYHEMLETIK